MLDAQVSSMLFAIARNVAVMTWRERIAEILEDTGMSQADLARVCGISRSAVNQWFDGTTKNPKPEHLFAVSDATHYSARWLATGRLPKTDTGKPHSAAKALYQAYCDASPTAREAIDVLLRKPYEGKSEKEQSG